MVDHRSPVVQGAEQVAEMTRTPGHGSDKEFNKEVRLLVGSLRERGSPGLRGVLVPILAERNRALADQLSRDGAAILENYDQLILTALSMRYDELDAALTKTAFAVAEIDGTGLISYANEALQKMVPDAVGRDFAALFGPRSRDVSAALLADERKTLRLDLHRGNLPSVHLRGEIGPLTDEHNRLGAYALLLTLDGEEARFDALPDGILRLDPDGKVVFANRRAEEIFGESREELQGRLAALLFSADKSSGGPPPIAEWMQSADGHIGLAELEPLNGSGSTPVRIRITPSFDTAESRAGAILNIVPIAKELVQADLHQLLSIPECEPERLVRGVMQAIRRVVPYDLATFGVYTDDMSHHHTLVVHPSPEWAWTTAWFPVNEASREFLLSEKTWGDDLQETAKALSPSIIEDDVFKQVVKSGMRGFVTLPISGGGQRVRASLTLLSKEAKRYDGREIEQMRELGVEKALLVAEANLLRRREDRIRALAAQLARAFGYRELASALAQGIADCFGWDYVAVFGVDRREELFRLIDQCNRTGSADVDSTYSQSLSQGLLGAALRANASRAVNNIEAGSQDNYKPVVPGRRSALAMPLRVVRQAANPTSDEIEWILSVESSQRNAFQGPDMVSLKEVLAQCEGILRQRWQNAVQASLLDAVEQAVVLVDQAGKVRLINRWAHTLLQSQGDVLLGGRFADFGAEESDRRLLRSTGPVGQARLALRIGKFVNVPTLASQRQLCDDYGHRLWLFTDLREQEEHSDWSYLEQTVNEVAQNSRLPLMLAGSLVRNAANRLLQEPAIATMLESAVRQLGKADITYERLATALAVRREPDAPPQIFDAVEVLWEAIWEFPEEDIQNCDLPDRKSPQVPKSFLITGWPEQLSFAFRSLLGHLLFLRPSESKVRITLANTNHDGLEVLLSVPIGEPSELVVSARPTDRIGMAERRAREAASLAPEAVTQAVRRHNGEFLIDTQDSSTLVFRVELQRMKPGSVVQ